MNEVANRDQARNKMLSGLWRMCKVHGEKFNPDKSLVWYVMNGIIVYSYGLDGYPRRSSAMGGNNKFEEVPI